VAFLFDTDAVSEVLKRRPMPAYVAWLRTVPRAEQFTSAVVVGELFKGAYRSGDSPRHLLDLDILDVVVLAVSSETLSVGA
jgi:predicted nucleic acid-binding protein